MISGMIRFLSGFRLLLTRSELRAIMWRMTGLLAVLILLLSVGMFWMLDVLVDRFIPTGDAFYIAVLAWLLWFFSLILSLAVAIVAYVVLGSIVASPWLDRLCECAEREEGIKLGAPECPWWKLVLGSIWNSVMPLADFLPKALLAALLLFVPVYGGVTASIVWSYGSFRLLAFEFMDAPASRRSWQWSQRKQEMDDNKWFYLGFAGLASALLVVPVLNLFVLPAAVVGLSRHLPNKSRDGLGRLSESPMSEG